MSSKDKDPTVCKDNERQKHLEELISTEERYVYDLTIVVDVFKIPIANSNLLINDQLKTIFNNWDEILECNNSFLRAIHVRREKSKDGIVATIGDILCENLPQMQIYVEFCARQRRAVALLHTHSETNKHFRALLDKCQSDPRAKGLPLSSFLIKPMQRITKYPLLISKILEYTNEGHPDRLPLEESLKKAEDLCKQVNEHVREKENAEQLDWLQNHVLIDELPEPLNFNSLTHDLGPRKLLHFGPLMKKSGKEFMGFLMNDLLLLVQPTRPLGGLFSFEKHDYISFRIYKQPLLLDDLIITGSSEDIDKNEFLLEHNKYIFHMCAPTENEKNLWLKMLLQAKNEITEQERLHLTRQRSKRRPKGMLKLIIVYGRNIAVQSLNVIVNEVFCEVAVGSKSCETLPVSICNGPNPIWQSPMKFLIKDLCDDAIHLIVKSKAFYSPDRFLGSADLPISDILNEIKSRGNRHITKVLKLQKVVSGEVTIMVDVHLFKHV
ncbi:intersectin-1 isoform X2 [Halyomorpha halys]|uniref:intersectin-1 isoform X2 n=1 Tax=Halyomorpha halys TaxID=286706 RepID=UPI000D0C8129|nr:intersectin-1-like isoform X2 [Halyomorpha halys]